jgi:nitroreductase
MSFLENLSWRFAEKNFDPTKTVEPTELNKVLDSIQMAPTSFGLQPFHVYVVTNPELKAAMKAEGWDQSQFTDASHILVFTSRTDALTRIDQYIELASGGNPEVKEKLNGYAEMMRGALGSRTQAEVDMWAKKQAYIALGFALAACAELHIDSCPIEGFASPAFNKILNLPEGQDASVVLAIGYKKADSSHHPKVRFDKSELFTEM